MVVCGRNLGMYLITWWFPYNKQRNSLHAQLAEQVRSLIFAGGATAINEVREIYWVEEWKNGGSEAMLCSYRSNLRATYPLDSRADGRRQFDDHRISYNSAEKFAWEQTRRESYACMSGIASYTLQGPLPLSYVILC